MNPQEIILDLHRHGHFWNLQFPEGLNVQEEDLPSLRLEDKVVKQALTSRQMGDANYRPLVMKHHNRDEPDYDGEVGPATLDLIALPRCPMPDFAPPPGARFHYPDAGLQKAVESMQLWQASGTGSWPKAGCDPERMGIHSFRVRINTSGAPAAVKAYMVQALNECARGYADIGLAVRYILDGNEPAEILKHFESMSGGVIGWNYFPQPNSCSRITGAFNRTFSPNVQTWADLEFHETGHGVGLPHTNGGVMNPSIRSNVPWPLTWRGDPSFNRLKGYFGGEPLVPLPPPIPPVTSWEM